MKKAFLIFCSTLLFALPSCSSSNDSEPGDNDISIQDSELNQNIFADEAEISGGVSFTTAGPWSSSISEKNATKSGTPDWVSIDPDHGTAAGNYTINIALENNYSGEDRTAEITIRCGDSSITISVTQKGVKEDGQKPEPPRLITSITESAVFQSDYYDGSTSYREYKPYSYEFKYDKKNRLKEFYIIDYYGTTRNKCIYQYHIQNEVRVDIDGSIIRGILGSNGYLKEIKYEDGDLRGNFSYDTNGYVANGKIEEYSYTYTWDNGNLTKVKKVREDRYDDESNYSRSYSSELNNKTNVDLNSFFFGIIQIEDWLFEYPMDAYDNLHSLINLTGKRSQNFVVAEDGRSKDLIESGIEIYSNSTEPEKGVFSQSYIRDFYGEGSYTFDSKDYPVKFTHQVEVVKYIRTYNGEKEFVVPSKEEEPYFIERYGPGPWFTIKLDLSEVTKYDTYTYSINYDK